MVPSSASDKPGFRTAGLTSLKFRTAIYLSLSTCLLVYYNKIKLLIVARDAQTFEVLSRSLSGYLYN